MNTAQAIFRISGVVEFTGLSRSTVYRLESLGQFPRRRALTPGAVGWLRTEVEDWIAGRVVGGLPKPVAACVARRTRRAEAAK